MLKKVKVTYGSDPELFFSRNGRIIGSEHLIPEYGIRGVNGKGRIVRDGVQLEMNPASGDNIRLLSENISSLFVALRDTLKSYSGVSLCFDTLVEVDKDELNALSPATRQLGCNPSYNIYGAKPITVNPLTYAKRSSAGHMHLGLPDILKNERLRTIPLHDIVVANTAVLLDRAPGAAERRENYGRAGEYRMPIYGIEYRTISNFWLRSPVLMSFVFGLSEIANAILYATLTGNDIESRFVEEVNIDRFTDAINTNDFKLALENFNNITPILKDILPNKGFVLNPHNIDTFLAFAKTVYNDGIERFFPTENIVESWCKYRFISFDSFLSRM